MAPPSAADATPAWLPGFSWAVPAAFASAVSACRFEQGDVLHSSPAAYADWTGEAPGPWIQVLDPPRSARALGGTADANRFASSWGSPVEIELADADAAVPRPLTTTQGRLFTCLWRGEAAALESREAPEPPLPQAELQRRLDSALPRLRKALGGGRRSAKAEAAMLFVSSIDHAGDASMIKAETIASALAARFDVRLHEASAAELDVPEADRFHPTLRVRGARVEASDEAAVTEALKAVLYNPGQKKLAAEASVESSDGEASSEGDAAGEGEPATRSDRFSLARHGLLVPLLAPAD